MKCVRGNLRCSASIQLFIQRVAKNTKFVAQSMPWSFGLLATLVQQVGCPQKNQHVLGGYVRAPKTLKPVVLLHISKCYKPRMISWRCGLLEHKF